MCGICGMVYKNPQQSIPIFTLDKMRDTLRHRGPDDSGSVALGRAGLAMRRLSIIDLSTGHQPLANEDETLWIVFNGEIYNFRELRSELQSLGHTFRTSSDTEVILHGYEAWGSDVCTKLNGMFGFAVWDTKSQKLLLARDRLGIKPMYYYLDEEKLVFGSEIKAILQSPKIRKDINYTALNDFLTFEYIPAPRSIFKDIYKLEPGHWLTFQDDKVHKESYWTLEPVETSIQLEEAKQQLEELLSDSVRMRLISDVPLGAFLSGGIDSSIMVALMSQWSSEPVKTFSIGFKEQTYNELEFARAVAKKYQTDHHEFIIETNALQLTEQLISHLDEPFGDFSIFPTYLVSKMARDHVTVCLSGDGGDELFAGYDAYRAHRLDRSFYHLLPKIVKHYGLEKLAKHLRPTEKKKGAINSFKRFIEGTRLPKSLYHARWMAFIQEEERKQLFSQDVSNFIQGIDPYACIHRYARINKPLSDVTKTGYIDVNTYLVDNILVKVDRMSMANSLEARVPFLDHRMVEYAFRLPPHFKMKGFDTKRILKQTFWDKLPKAVQNRDKRGFSIPIKNWIRGELKPMMMELLDPTQLQNQGIFNPDFTSKLVDEHLQGIENHSHKLWCLMVFQQWMKLYGN